MEDELDLRELVAVLVKRWKLIAATTVVAALAALVVSLLLPPTYEATAGIAIVKYKPAVSFDSRFETLSEEELALAGRQIWDLEARRQAFAELVRSGAIAEQVIAELGSQLDERERQPAKLLVMVKGEVGKNSDLIRITVQADDPDKAAAIANAWGRLYEQQVNSLYSGAAGAYAMVQSQEVEAKAQYDAAQAALAAFIAEDRADELKRLIGEKQTVIDKLQQGRTIGLQQQVQEKIDKLQTWYTTKAKLERLLEDAQALRQQAETGGSESSATNSLAVLLLKAQAFATSAGLPSDLELQLGQIEGFHSGVAAQVADLDALCAVLQERTVEVEGEIRGLSQELLSSASYDFLAPGADLDPSAAPGRAGDIDSDALAGSAGALEQVIARLENEVRQLQAELEQEATHQRDLQSARDLAWETFSALSSKKAETGVEAAVIGSEVRFASSAVPPVQPVSPRKLLNTAVAGMLALLAGVLGVLLVEYLRLLPALPDDN